jgi:hypothetical protein
MLPIFNKKRSMFICTVFAVIILILTFYISAPITNSYTVIQKFQLYSTDNHSDIPSIRVCCLILTTPKNLLNRAKAINDTWAPRCDRYFFITEINRDTMTPDQLKFTQQIPIAPIKDIIPGYDHLTQKSTLAFLFAYENYFNDCDWFVKADDDTYLLVDNLKAFLSEQNSSEPVTFGYNFKVINADLHLSYESID